MTRYWTDPEPLSAFSGRMHFYDAHRVSTPPAVLDAVIAGLGAPEELMVADVGAGTGTVAVALAERGLSVLAVEPNADMRSLVPRHPDVLALDGTAEATGISSDRVDVVVCVQAFHWFDPAASLAEFGRILRPGGRLALVFHERLVASPFEREYHALLRTLKPNWRKDKPPHRAGELLAGVGGFKGYRVERFEHARTFDAESLLGRTLSLSYAPREEERVRELEESLADLLRVHGGRKGVVAQGHRSHVYLAESSS